MGVPALTVTSDPNARRDAGKPFRSHPHPNPSPQGGGAFGAVPYPENVPA